MMNNDKWGSFWDNVMYYGLPILMATLFIAFIVLTLGCLIANLI